MSTIQHPDSDHGVKGAVNSPSDTNEESPLTGSTPRSKYATIVSYTNTSQAERYKCSRRTFFPFWFCLTFLNTSVILLLSFGMFVGGVMMWKTVDKFFGIVDNVDEVICVSCVTWFTYTTLILGIGGVLTIITQIGCCAFKGEKLLIGMLITLFCAVAGVLGIITITTEPIWLSRQSNILERFEESSDLTFRKQLSNATIQGIWDDYQSDFGCCGVHNYNDYRVFLGNDVVPLSCCNLTAIPSTDNCSSVVENVTKEAVQNHYIYTEGCPTVIVEMLHLNSTSVHTIGIVAAAGSAFFLVSVISIVILTMVIIPEDTGELLVLLYVLFLGVCLVLKVLTKCK